MPSGEGETLLIKAIRQKNKGVISYLLLAKQEIIDINYQSDKGITALIMAVSNNDYTTVDLLISKGVDVNARTKNGVTALKLAKQLGYQEIYEKLKIFSKTKKVTESKELISELQDINKIEEKETLTDVMVKIKERCKPSCFPNV